ncbi:hypothetical protein DL769_011441 [Monosporascus sp. CRB-8-3]|nr:hypothetical protein DL769_011441 [Monosporascus sp. CRB-8-3]
MRFSEVLITLGSIISVSAIDAYLHWLESCTTNALICTNVNPTVCCRSGRESDRFLAIGFRAIPSDWSIVGEGHSAWNCVGSIQLQGGPPDICIRGGLGSYGGARYYFPNKKARNNVVDPTCIPVRPDALGLANGTQYNLTDLSGAAFDQLFTRTITPSRIREPNTRIRRQHFASASSNAEAPAAAAARRLERGLAARGRPSERNQSRERGGLGNDDDAAAAMAEA